MVQKNYLLKEFHGGGRSSQLLCYKNRIVIPEGCKKELCNGITTLYATQELIKPKKQSLNIFIGKHEQSYYMQCVYMQCMSKNKRNSTKSMDYSQKKKLNINHGNICASISLVLIKYEQRHTPELRCVTMINPATGWFEIKQYDDKKSITVANIVEQEWLAR